MMREIKDLVFLLLFQNIIKSMSENIECLVNKERFLKNYKFLTELLNRQPI